MTADHNDRAALEAGWQALHEAEDARQADRQRLMVANTELRQALIAERAVNETAGKRLLEVTDLLTAERERVAELTLALDKADPLDPSFIRYLELEEQLQAANERAEELARKLDAELLRRDTERPIWKEQLQAEREKAALAAEVATHVRQLHAMVREDPDVRAPGWHWSDWLARYDALNTPTTEVK